MKKIEGAVFEQFREMELGDWSAARGGDSWTYNPNTSTANNNTCDSDGEYVVDVDEVEEIIIYL